MPAIRHFGFFNCWFEQKLWQVLLEWLKFGRVPAGCNLEGIEIYNTVPDEPSPSLV